ncbi:polyamine ABC transporter substrate-binding protein [Crenobacter cavernae]|uniref:Putrescine-binding periplasmic protein n=1 Tax=Crenobacter cavernae TaxID=2290923 RepID=A0A345YAG3_9NEIS|nr:polyamine ABC transporter substrate-binding protein [Crenobacter cavernae]AXK40915.1 polyamine ABC transporter substrate-binding protein [Crenobacter cavernae]
MKTRVLAAVFCALPGFAHSDAVLNVYNWSDYIAPDTVKNFEKETGIKVRYDLFDSNEILQAKMLTGHSSYDLVVPSNGFLARQIPAGVYQKLDKGKLKNYGNLKPDILEAMAEFDPGNAYAIPYLVSTITLGVNVDKVKAALGQLPMPANEWDLLFDPQYVSKLKSCGVSVLDTPSESLLIAMHYLGKSPKSTDPADWRAAAALYRDKVRPSITRFSSSGYVNEFAKGSLCLVMGYGSDLNIAKRRAADARPPVRLKTLAPSRGVMIGIESLVIPRDAPNAANAHRFIDYLLRPDVAVKIAEAVTATTPNSLAEARLPQSAKDDPTRTLPPAMLKASFLQPPADAALQRLQTRLWTGVKTRK